MASGIRAEVSVDADGTCPVVTAARSVDASSDAVSRSVNPDLPDRITEEFTLETDGETPRAEVELSAVFDYGSRTAYRFSRELGRGCPCERVEAFDTPVIDVRAREGMLHLTFHAADMEGLQNIITSLQSTFPTVDVKRLLRSEHDQPVESLVFVDRSRLTDRQREVLETAHEMGYFEHPKRANAGDVATELDITTSTFSEHLSAAQSKLLDAILDS